LKAPESRYLF